LGLTKRKTWKEEKEEKEEKEDKEEKITYSLHDRL